MSSKNEGQLLLGKILGEIYRMQRRLKIPCPAGEADIYALLNGFEEAADRQLEMIGFVPRAHVAHVMNVLEPIWADEAKLKAFKGFYDVETELQAGGVDRIQAIKILRYFKANGQFAELIAKMDSSHSPTECRTFDLDQFDT